jgi:inosine-uridine nucleoside N-ribohydrolase
MQDATAAQEVTSHAATLPIYLAPLDITTQHTMLWSDYTKLVDSSFPDGEPPSSLAPLPFFTSAFLRHTVQIMKRYGKSAMELHDPLSVWFALEAAKGNMTTGGWETQRHDFAVER